MNLSEVLNELDVQAMLLRIEYEIAMQNMSKKDFYEKSGVSSSLYSQYNTGASRPSWRSIGKMANALGVSIDYLLGLPIEKENSPSDEDELLDELQMLKDREDLRALLRIGYKNTPEQVRKLAELMESMNQ